MASPRPPNLERPANVNSFGVGQGEKDSKYSALLEAWSSFGDAKAQLDGLEKRVDGAVLIPQKRTPAPRVPSSSKPKSSHVVRYKEHQGPSPLRGTGAVKHRQSSRKRRERPKEKENEKKDERVEKETDETRKEESSVTLEGSVLNSDSQLNDTFTISPEQHSVLQHRHTHTDQDALEGTVTAAEEPLGPANKVVFEQLVEPAETKTSPRKDMQTAASPYSLQRTNRSAVFGPPINFKEEVGGKGGQERHSDRQWGRRDEGASQQHVHPTHLLNRTELGPRGVLREFAMPPMATLASLQERATLQQHAMRETAAVVQSLLHRPLLQPRAVGTGGGEIHPLSTGVSARCVQEKEGDEGARQDTHLLVRKVCLSPGKGAPQGHYSGPAPSTALGEGQRTANAPQHDPFVVYSQHFAHNPSLYSKVDLPVQQHREVPSAPVMESGEAALRGGLWTDPFPQEPVERKRKVAFVPPPKPALGVAATRRGREGAGGVAPPSRLARMDGQDQAASGRSEGHHAPRAHGVRSTAPKTAVRKVAKQTQQQHAKGGLEKTITPFSWRAGKELSDKVLAALKQVESAKVSDRLSSSVRPSAVSQPEAEPRSGVNLSPLRRPQEGVKQSPSHHHPARLNAAQLLADMDLEPSEDEAMGEGAELKQQRAKSGRGGRKQASGPPKRPKYNFEPVYNIPKTRHYKSEDVQQYMRKKKEERRKENDEHKKAAERQKQLTEQRLQELSQARKQRLNMNLAKVYSKQRHPELTFLKHVSAGLTQNTSGGIDTPSCSDMEESAQEQPPPPTLTRPPVSAREWERPSPRSSPAKGVDLPPPSLSPSPSETCSDEDTPTGSELEEVPLLVSEKNRGRREVAEKGALSSVPAASMSPVLGAVRRPTSAGPLVHPHSLLVGKGTQTKQDRLRALSISALTLKAKVEMERKRILEAAQLGIIPDMRTPGSPVNVGTRGGSSPGRVSSSTSPRRSIGINTEQQPTEYPGVGNLDTHLLAMRRERKERSAATSIQAAFRGYVVRKAVRGTGRWPSSSASYVEENGADMDIETRKGRSTGSLMGFTSGGVVPQELGGSTAPPTAPPTAPSAVPPTASLTVPPTALSTSLRAGEGEGLQPWERRGGDVHSLVHIIAKQEAKRRRKAAEEALSVSHRGAVENIGVQVDSIELNMAGADLTETRGADHSAQREDNITLVQEGSGSTIGALAQQQASPQGGVLSPEKQTSSTRPLSAATPPAPAATPSALAATPPEQNTRPPVRTTTPPAQTATPPAPLISMEPDSLTEDSTMDTSTPELSQTYGAQGKVGLAPAVPLEGGEAEETGKMSPRSLQLKLSAELMLLETAQDQMHHLGEVERARQIAQAQREILSGVEVLKRAHEEEIRALSAKTELELGTVRQQLQLAQDEANVAAVRVESLQRETQVEVDRSTQLMAKQEREAQLQLAEARKVASEAVIAAARRQLEGAHDRATQTAIVAAKKVEATLAGQREGDRGGSLEIESCSDTTPSLGEGEDRRGARSDTEESDSASESQTPTESNSGKEKSEVTVSEGDISEDLDSTLVAEEVEERSTSSGTVEEGTEARTPIVASPVKSRKRLPLSKITPTSQGRVVPDAEQEPDEVSFRMVLPSEGHRRRQRQDHRPRSPRLSLSSSFSSDVASPSPSASSLMLPDEAAVPKELSNASVLSVGEESFDDFTLRMIKQHVRDQDARSRHQVALLKLKERALEEQTKAKLTVLEQWKRRLRKKGDDDHMPVVLKKEKGLMRNYKNAKAEIRSLWHVQHQEKEERRRLLLQQREVGKLRLSAQNYWEKARQLEEDEGNVSVSVSSVSSVSQISGRLESPVQTNVTFPQSTSTPLVRTKSPHSMHTSISEEVPEEEEGEEGSVAEVFEQPSVAESLAKQSSLLMTISSAPSTSQIEGKSVTVTGKGVTEEPSRLSSSELLGSRRSEEVGEAASPAGRRAPDTRSTTTPSTIEEHPLTHRLNKADYATTERRLAKRDEQLKRQQKMAEGALAAQQRLLEKEKQLKQKEEQISLLLDQAEELRAQRLGLSSGTAGGSQRKGDGIHDRSSEMERSPQKVDSVRKRRDSLEEQSGAGEVPEESIANPPSSMTVTSIAEVLSAYPAQGVEPVTEEVSEDIKAGPSEGFGEYSRDTFESITTAAGVLTSTPHSMRRDQQVVRDDVPSPQRISESPTDVTTISSMTTATESSEIEQRIRQLKEDLSHRKEEVRRVKQEQKRRKRGLLQEKEEQLKKKLKALEQKLQGAKQSLSLVVPSNVSLHSTTATESEGEREQHTSLRRERPRHRAHAGGDVAARMVPSVEPSLSYTPFTDQEMEERVSPAKTDRSGDQSTVVMGGDVTLTSPQVKEEAIKTASVEDESIKTAKVEDESIKTATVKDESIKTATVEDESIKTATVEDEAIKSVVSESGAITPSLVENVQSALLAEEQHLSAKKTGVTPSASSVKSPTLSSPSHSVQEELHSSSLSSLRRSAKGLAASSSGKLSPRGSPSRIPIPTRLAHSSQSSSPTASLRSLKDKKSEERKGSEVHSEQDETLKDADSYSETFTAVSESQGGPREVAEDVQGLQTPPVEDEHTTEEEEEEEEEEDVLTEVEEQLTSSASEDELTSSPLPDEGTTVLAPSALLSSGATAELAVEEDVLGAEVPQAVDVLSQLVESLQVGQRVMVGGAVAGVVRFVGNVHFTSGTFIGVQLNEKKGKNDGSFDGVRYFDCPEGYGLFAPPSKVSLLQEGKGDTAGDILSGPEEDEAASPFEQDRLSPEAMLYPPLAPGETEGGRSPSTESPTPSEVSSLDVEEVVPSDLEEEEEEEEEEGPHVETQHKEKIAASPDKLSTVNGVASGLMQKLMKELVIDVSAAAQRRRARLALDDREKQRSVMADSITADLLGMFLQSEVHLMCNIRNAKKAALDEENAMTVNEPPAEVPVKPSNLSLAAGRVAIPSTHPPSVHRLSPEPGSSTLSPPPSPPGSPPRYSARAYAGDRSPPPTLPPDASHPHVGAVQVERPMSPVSITSLMEEHPFSEVELNILPRDKPSVDKIAEIAWNDYLNTALERKVAGMPFETPKSVLAVRSMSSQPTHLITDDEQACRDSFGHLVYQLSLDVIHELQPAQTDCYSPRQSINWKMKMERRKSLVDPPLTLNNVKQIVFARLVEGRLPIRLPKGRYHHGLRRPGGKEVDFLEAILIKELRADERNWTEFEEDEREIKLKTADRILNLLLDEVVQEVKAIERKSHT